MRKPELIEKIAAKSGFNKAESEKFYNAFMESLKDALLEGEEVKLIGFGNFTIVDKEATECRNPMDPNKKVKVPAHKVVKFKISKKLKDLVKDQKPAKTKKVKKASKKNEK